MNKPNYNDSTLRLSVVYIIIFFTSICIYGCKDSKREPKVNSLTVLTDMEKEEQAYAKRCSLLGIDNLKINKEEPQIRIWTVFSIADSGNVIILKKTDELNWIGQYCQYRFDTDSLYNVLLKHKKIVNGEPISGWNNFLEKIKTMGVYNLSDSGRRNNYGLCNEGGGFIVEITKDNKYFEYIYPCWMSEKNENKKQINEIKDILTYVEKEFNFKIYPINY